ncbi:hypothetical protein M011DRAFT_466744 [Sporormia fimetaria CBS 119925]|uniref:Zn(2)-C6 fungal-type domain-containing protein n=1 Tax=Sporormia fimetaria CBS 119925 TaxID=1340428 RepID=A0A6A6VCM8_9PLEO|nr:hypothetical protein M011DRAFT_466744 [Sporormia fimetaria CBS 119925]
MSLPFFLFSCLSSLTTLEQLCKRSTMPDAFADLLGFARSKTYSIAPPTPRPATPRPASTLSLSSNESPTLVGSNDSPTLVGSTPPSSLTAKHVDVLESELARSPVRTTSLSDIVAMLGLDSKDPLREREEPPRNLEHCVEDFQIYDSPVKRPLKYPDAETEMLKEQVKMLESEKASVNKTMRDKDRQIRQGQETLFDTHSKLKKLTAALEEEREKNKELQAIKEAFNKTVVTLERRTHQLTDSKQDLKQAHAEVEELKKALSRLENTLPGGFVKGAANLVVPAVNTTFRKTVLPCIRCLNSNRACDNKSECAHCRADRQKCPRFRCSAQHLLKRQCPPGCLLKHDDNGWLEADSERPEW